MENKKITVIDVAKYVLSMTGENISVTRLNNLCYFSQAWNFAWTKDFLFNDDFYLVPFYQTMRSKTLDKIIFKTSDSIRKDKVSDLTQIYLYGNINNLTIANKNVITAVVHAYERFDDKSLQDYIDKYDMPTILTDKIYKQNLCEYNKSEKTIECVIEKKLIGDFYGNKTNSCYGESNLIITIKLNPDFNKHSI